MADHTLWHETLHDQFGQYFAVDNVLYHEKPITGSHHLRECCLWPRDGAGRRGANDRAR